MQVDLPGTIKLKLKKRNIYVDWPVSGLSNHGRGPSNAHVSIHFLSIGTPNIHPDWHRREHDGKTEYMHKATHTVRENPPYIPTLSSHQLDTTQGKGEANAGAVHFKFDLKTTGEEICLGIQWELSMTLGPSADPFHLMNTDFAVSLSHKVVHKDKNGNFVQMAFAKKMCHAVAGFIEDVGNIEGIFKNPKLDSVLKSTLMRKAAADCIHNGSGKWKSNEQGDPFNVLGLEQLMIANALKQKVTIAMVMEEDGTPIVKYNPIACIEVSPGILKHGLCIPMIRGIRIRDGNYGSPISVISVGCAFDRHAVTTKSSLAMLLRQDLHPVRRLSPAEEVSFEPFYSHPRPLILQQIIDEINAKAEAEAGAAAKAREAAAAAAAEAQEKAEAQEAAAVAAESDDSVVFEAIFRFAKKTGRLPYTNEVELVRQFVIGMNGSEINDSLITSMITRVQMRIIKKVLEKSNKKNDAELKSHYNMNVEIYTRVYDSGI
jgi:hypothetical protein